MRLRYVALAGLLFLFVKTLQLGLLPLHYVFPRFYLSYHSISQVVYGSLLGVVIGGIWFIFVQVITV